MPKDNKSYLDDYIREAGEYIDNISKIILHLEKSPNDEKKITKLLTNTHTLKSLASMMDFSETESLCHELENVFESISKENQEFNLFTDTLLYSCDLLKKNLQLISQGDKELSSSDLIQQMALIQTQGKENTNQKERLSNYNSQYQIEPVKFINVKVDRLDELMYISEELLINHMSLEQAHSKIKSGELALSLKKLNRLISDFQFLIIQARLVPLEYIFNRFPRIVRDIAKKENKNIDLQIRGMGIELDRSIIDELGDCIVHLVRNAIDHGIETKEQRIEKNKFELATISINAYRNRNRVIIEISDDGKGLPVKKIRRIAEQSGLIEKNSTETDVIRTIFTNLTTSGKTNKLSGRGVGLAIVKAKVEALGGQIDVKSVEDKGSTFLLDLPLT